MPTDSASTSSNLPGVPPFNEIIRFIKEYDGNELYLSKFIRDLTFAKESCGKDELLAKRVLNYSITQLVGKAAQVTTYLTFNTFEELTTHLIDSFGRRKNLAELENDLSNMKQFKGETIAEFYNRLQETMFSLIGAVTRDSPTALVKIKIESIKNYALNKFHYSINDRIATMIRSSKPKTLEEAYSIAINEERALIMTDSLSYNKKYCTHCKNKSHDTNSCYKLRNKSHNSNNYKEIKTVSTSQNKFCKYCKKSGHLVNECFKLKRKKEQEKTNVESRENLNSNRPQGTSANPQVSFSQADYTH